MREARNGAIFLFEYADEYDDDDEQRRLTPWIASHGGCTCDSESHATLASVAYYDDSTGSVDRDCCDGSEVFLGLNRGRKPNRSRKPMPVIEDWSGAGDRDGTRIRGQLVNSTARPIPVESVSAWPGFARPITGSTRSMPTRKSSIGVGTLANWV